MISIRLFVIGTVLCTLFALAQPKPVRTARISGRVVNSATNEGVPRAKVRLFWRGEDSSKTYVIQADGMGTFNVELAIGTYAVECFRTGFIRPEGMAGPSRALRVENSDKPVSATCELLPAASIEGTVVDSSGEPFEGAHVDVEKAVQGVRGSNSAAAMPSFTDAFGRFRITGLPPGRYFVSVTPTRQDIILQADGPPRVQLTTYFPGTSSRANAQVIPVRAGETTQVDIRVASVPMVRIRGRYLDSEGNPKQGIVAVEHPGYPASGFHASTAEDGSFDLEVPQGDWLLTGPRRDARGQFEAVLPITVTEQPLENLVLQSQEPAAIVGNLEYANADNGTASKVRVILKNTVTGLPAGDLDFSGPSIFQFADLLPGKYEFEVLNQGCDCYLSAIFLNGQRMAGTEVDLTAGSQYQATLRFERPAGRIEGAVAGKADEGVRPSLVAVVLPVGQRVVHPLSLPFPNITEDRKFAFRDLRPGAYRVWVIADLEWIYLTDPAFIDEIEKSAKTIVVKAGETASVEVPITPKPF